MISNSGPVERRKRRQQSQQYEHSDGGDLQGGGPNEGAAPHGPPECLSHDYEALAVGCSGSSETLEFRSGSCTHQPISGTFRLGLPLIRVK